MRRRRYVGFPTIHGEAGKTVEYMAWTNMRRRCLSPHNPNYDNYGGKGITICPEWNDYDVFLADMGRKSSSESMLDRIDNNGNYEPGNCRWATPGEQAQNRTNTKLNQDNINQIRHLYRRGIYNQYELAYWFDVSQFNINQIVNNDSWKAASISTQQLLFETTPPIMEIVRIRSATCRSLENFQLQVNQRTKTRR